MDHDMHFFTMSLKEWQFFCSELEITTGHKDAVTQRQIRQSFWRAQGAFAPDHGSAVAMKEREDFLEKMSANSEDEVSAICTAVSCADRRGWFSHLKTGVFAERRQR